jgi:hypothetical protein
LIYNGHPSGGEGGFFKTAEISSQVAGICVKFRLFPHRNLFESHYNSQSGLDGI